jgi:hypothetical protein
VGGMERILEIIDTVTFTVFNFVLMLARHSCAFVLGTINGITDPQVQGGLSLLVFIGIAALTIWTIWWWFHRLNFFVSLHSPRAPRTSLGDLFLLIIASLIVPLVLVYVCFFILCWVAW